MLRIKTILTLFTLYFFCVSMKAGGFVAYTTANIFDIPGDTSYLEVEFKVPATSLKFTLENLQNYTAKVKVYMGIYQNGKAFFADKYVLTSPAIDNRAMLNFNLLDARRVKLAPGTYSLELSLQDANDTSQHAFVRKDIIVPLVNNGMHFSDIVMLDSVYPAKEKGVFTRLNYNMLPAVVNYIPPTGNSLFFYTEIYNTQPYAKNGMVQVHYSILPKSNSAISPQADSFIHAYSHIKTKPADKTIYLFDGIDVKNLPTGKYFLQLQVMNDSQKVIASRVMLFIRRKNGGYSSQQASAKAFTDSLSYKFVTDYSKYLYAIETTDENDRYALLQSKKDTAAVKAWFYEFWKTRDILNPYQAFKDYDKLVVYCQENFKSPVSPGYKSDRGRVCLKYGIPDHVVSSENEPAAYEYQIWRYNFTQKQTNVHFIFYNPTQMPADYVLLNSDAIGETQNPMWKKYIYRRTNTDVNLDHNTMPNGLGNDLDLRMAE